MKLHRFIIAVGLFVALIMAVETIFSYMHDSWRTHLPASTNTDDPWTTYSVISAIPGAPSFSFGYPSIFRKPIVTVASDTIESIDFDRTDVGKEPFFNMFFYVIGSRADSLDEIANRQLDQNYLGRIQYHMMVDHNPAIAQKISARAALTSYYVRRSSGTILDFVLGEPIDHTDIEGSIERSRKLEDKIMQSVKFTSN